MKLNSIQGSNRGSVLLETISSRIREIKEEMYPLEEKLAPLSVELDNLLNQQKQIRMGVLEKQQNTLNHPLKLITLLRKILITGIPVFVTGDIRTGKTALAKEIASYGFSKVTFLGELINQESEVQFTNSIANHKSTNHLLVLDEYQRLPGTKMEITESFLTQYNGSLMVITHNSSNLPSFELFPEFYTINLVGDIFYECDYTIKHFKKNARSEEMERFFNYEISVPLTTKCALTVSSVLDYLQLHIFDNNVHYKGQCLAALNKLKSQLTDHDYYVQSIVPILEKIVASESSKYTEYLLALANSAINLQELSITGERTSDCLELGRFHVPSYYNIVEETAEINIKKDYPEKEIYKLKNS